jgi:hypothetical protein
MIDDNLNNDNQLEQVIAAYLDDVAAGARPHVTLPLDTGRTWENTSAGELFK